MNYSLDFSGVTKVSEQIEDKNSLRQINYIKWNVISPSVSTKIPIKLILERIKEKFPEDPTMCENVRTVLNELSGKRGYSGKRVSDVQKKRKVDSADRESSSSNEPEIGSELDDLDEKNSDADSFQFIDDLDYNNGLESSSSNEKAGTTGGSASSSSTECASENLDDFNRSDEHESSSSNEGAGTSGGSASSSSTEGASENLDDSSSGDNHINLDFLKDIDPSEIDNNVDFGSMFVLYLPCETCAIPAVGLQKLNWRYCIENARSTTSFKIIFLAKNCQRPFQRRLQDLGKNLVW